ncbi:MAG TPA: hypothetical protein VGM29_06635 [Polyangiaceae bacterium]|jgi:hypothetical protein
MHLVTRALLTAGLFGLVAGTPGLARAEESEPDEPAEHAVRPGPRRDELPAPSARTNAVLVGSAVTAGWYGLALGSSFLWPDAVGAHDLRIPVAGPWMALSHTGCGHVSDCSTVVVVLRAIATSLDAVGQAGGLAVIGEGLFLPTREPERAPAHATNFRFYPSFDAEKGGLHFGLSGVF